MKNFKDTADSDYDYTKMERTFTGRMTKARWRKLQSVARKFTNAHIYGTSPNGYAYRCGCEHDCCGCLSSQSMVVTYDKKTFRFPFHSLTTNLYQVKITITQSFNY